MTDYRLFVKEEMPLPTIHYRDFPLDEVCIDLSGRSGKTTSDACINKDNFERFIQFVKTHTNWMQ